MFARNRRSTTVLCITALTLACGTPRTPDASQARFKQAIKTESYKWASEQIDLMSVRAPNFTKFLLAPDSRVITPDMVVKTGIDSILDLYGLLAVHKPPIMRVERTFDSVRVDTARADVRLYGLYTMLMQRSAKTELEPVERGCYASRWHWADTSWVRALDSLSFCPERVPAPPPAPGTGKPAKKT